MKSTFLLAVAASLSLLAGAASAATLDFSDLQSGSCNFVGSPVVSQGYRFTDVSGGGLFLCNGFVIHNNANPALIAANTRSVLQFERSDAAPFSLQSFLAGARTNSGPGSVPTGIEVVGTTGSGSISQTFNFNGLTFENFTLNPSFTGLQNVRITALGDGASPQFLINAIVVDAPASAVPEPASWALLIAGFGLVGATLRRRRAATGIA